MKAKHLVSLIAAVALVLCMALPAYATSKTVITATFKAPTIRVSVPSTGKVYINPTKLTLSSSTGVQFDEEKNVVPQVVSVPNCIRNESEVPIEVNISAKGTVSSGSGITLVKTSTSGSTSKSKNLFMFLQMKAVDESDAKDLENVRWDSVYDADEHVLIGTTTASKNAIVTLDEADGEKSYGAFLLSGDCITEPTKPWKSTDKLNVNVVFTFTPLPRPAK